MCAALNVRHTAECRAPRRTVRRLRPPASGETCRSTQLSKSFMSLDRLPPPQLLSHSQRKYRATQASQNRSHCSQRAGPAHLQCRRRSWPCPGQKYSVLQSCYPTDQTIILPAHIIGAYFSLVSSVLRSSPQTWMTFHKCWAVDEPGCYQFGCALIALTIPRARRSFVPKPVIPKRHLFPRSHGQ